MFGIAALLCGGVSKTQACTNLSATSVGHVPVTTSVFVPSIVSSSVATHLSGFGVVALPQAVVVPQAVTVQSLLIPQWLPTQIARQRVRVTPVPRLGVRSLICR
jgi:hypothetical protein